MKKLLLLAAMALPVYAGAQNVVFEDPNFKTLLLTQYGTFLDTNNDGEIQLTEAATFTNINASPLSGTGNITSLGGIEAFTNLTILMCLNQQLTTLDLSNNPNLTVVNVNYNHLTSLNLTNCNALTVIGCVDNELTSLDVTGKTALINIMCSENHLTSLDLSTNTALTSVLCSDNELTTLNFGTISTLTFLACSENQITSLDVSHNPNIYSIACNKNQLTTLDVSNVAALDFLACGDNQLTELDVTDCPILRELACNANTITSLDLSQNPLLQRLLADDNNLSALDLSGSVKLKELYCGYNPLTSLNLSNSPLLTFFSCGSTNLTSLDVSNNPALVYFICPANFDLTYINLKNGSNAYLNQAAGYFIGLPALEMVCLDENLALSPYLLGEVNHDVTFTSECLAATDKNTRPDFAVYPNPANSLVTIISNTPVAAIEVYSSLGQLVATSAGTNSVDISNLSTGMYHTKISDIYGNTTTKSIIKQ